MESNDMHHKGRLRVGMRVRTNYGTGPYRITHVSEECTCPSFLDSLELGNNAPKSKPHYHLACKKDGLRDKFYLNGYDENLNSVWNNDRLIVCEEETMLLTLLCSL